jgi:hypothetical protein
MPRWATRTVLALTEVRCERSNQITEADARAEGCEGVEHFARAWDGAYGAGSWAAGGWCWVLGFRRVDQG